MPWTETTRPHYRRANRRYASDLTDGEWALVKPFMPKPSRRGRPRKTDLRQVLDALLYVASTGNLVGWLIHSADIQDRDGAAATLATIRHLHPWMRHIFADGGYAGDKLRSDLAGMGRWTVEIIKRSDKAKGFEVLPKRWVVERTLAWLGRCRRLAKDFEATVSSATAWLVIAHIRTLTRRLARG